ncbi:hypothetical protein EL75_1224 [Escherichia coli]|nr:hypothetical protein EL77_1261 [Escherichia coli]KGM71083.1 hypothetical protein EL75_1224 [Escherichia coli]KGM74600.1 hypothetical protein EL78_1256 [Escherichia coli]KGM82424.1 hypothetical protein EL80_1241 [Escherichia coli]KGM84653.1 hypothetical protein EL79_1236 [Escherichia coli]
MTLRRFLTKIKYCICRQQQLLKKCALFMPDAA